MVSCGNKDNDHSPNLVMHFSCIAYANINMHAVYINVLCVQLSLPT